MKPNRNEKKLIIKINKNKNAQLNRKEIAIILSNLRNFSSIESKEKLQSIVNYMALFNNKHFEKSEEEVNVFNKYCKVETWFNMVSLEDDCGHDVQVINKKDPFVGFGIEVKEPNQFISEINDLEREKNLSLSN